MSNTGQAWVTLATNDSYALGALVLAQSLKRNNTIHQLAVLITPGVSPSMREALSSVFDVVREVDVLDSQDAANLALLERPDLGVTFTKLHCWNLTQFTKCVFLDADTLVVKNSDELFERDELSAAPDAGWPDCFNSGVFVFTPSEATFKSLLEFALTNGSFDGGDQGLLNMYFGDWATKDITKHLPFIYNMVATATYSYLPAFKAFGGNVKIAHFIGSSKPWLQALPSGSTLSNFLDLWWDIFLKDVSKKLDTNMGGLAGALAGGQRDVIEDQFRKQSWEQGNIDYMGKDAFENIWKKMSETVDDIKPLETPAPETPAPETPSTPEESAPAPETPKTEDKTDSSEVETQQISAPPVETPQLKVEEPQQEAPKVEPVSETATVDEAVEPPKPDAPQQPTDAPKAEEKPKEVSKPAALPAEAAPAQPAPEVKPESESAPSAAGEATLQDQAVSISIPPLSVATEAPAPAAVEPLPAAATESDVSAPIVVPQPPTPTVEPPTPPLPEPAKDPSTPPPAEKKEASPPKDAAPEKVAAPLQEPVAPASPSTPSPASPSAPEGTKIDSTQAPPPPDPQTPTAETSSPPQTPVGDAPVPPKRSSKKGKAKK